MLLSLYLQILGEQYKKEEKRRKKRKKRRHRNRKEGRKERNILFNDALNTFYLRLYGVGHIMVKDHSDSERGNPLPPHGLLFLISSKGSRRQDSTYHGPCYTSRGALAGTKIEIDGT